MDDTYRLRAVVLGREAYRENDLSVDLLTEEFGRMRLIARGAKKFKAKLAAHVEPFCVIEVMVVRGRRDDYLGSTWSSECFSIIKSDLERLKGASEAVVLVKSLIREKEPLPGLFKALIEYLTYLNALDIKPGNFQANLFAYKVLNELGLAPNLEVCGNCGRKLKSGCNVWRASTSQILGQECGKAGDLTITDEIIKILRLVNSSFFSMLAYNFTRQAKLAEELNRIITALKEVSNGGNRTV